MDLPSDIVKAIGMLVVTTWWRMVVLIEFMIWVNPYQIVKWKLYCTATLRDIYTSIYLRFTLLQITGSLVTYCLRHKKPESLAQNHVPRILRHRFLGSSLFQTQGTSDRCFVMWCIIDIYHLDHFSFQLQLLQFISDE